MSASEKLKALNGRFEGLRIGSIPPPVFEITVWPQIVAVVEAAERATEYVDQHGSKKAAAVLRQEVKSTLAALEEALS